jgi:hypothetical protein
MWHWIAEVPERWKGEQAMPRVGLFTRHVYIRLVDDETGFLYTVKYGWLSLPSRLIRCLTKTQIYGREK